MYYLYHIPGKKIGVTRDLKERVERQQGYNRDEYDILTFSPDIDFISELEIQTQREYGYRVDMKPYNKLKCNNMNINVTEQTTTFPCPVSKLLELVCERTGIAMGTYYHFAHNLHIYSNKLGL